MKTSPLHGRIAGFTVTELVMVMTIIGILTAIGVPSFKYVTASNRISSEINALLGDMQFARSQAIKQGLTVTVCSSSNSTLAAPTCNTGGAGNTWNTGWIVFLDSNGDGQVNNGEQVIRVQPAFNGTDTLQSMGSLAAVTYNRLGYAPTWNGQTINIALHDANGLSVYTRCLAITASGSVSTEKAGMGNPVCN
jgi:type IV fimbrial biogenesis protein FimT